MKKTKTNLIPCNYYGISKILMVMKLSIALCVAGILQVSAGVYSQTSIDLEVQDKSLKEVLKMIEQKSEFRFFYSDNVSALEDRVSFKAENLNVITCLEQLFEKSHLTYRSFENNLIVIAPKLDLPQNRITGIVTDAITGEPLPGVNILIEGTSIGTVTDLQGKYTLDLADDNVVLFFSFIGYMDERVEVTGKTVINLAMAPDIKALDEVLVVGYGKQTKATLSGSVSQIKGSEIAGTPVTNLSNSLGGLLPGLISVTRGSEPGGDGSQLLIRGLNTLGNNSPLVVVDGVPGRSLERLDPSTVESISVLKDASAAIYGAQAANGVILVTTKRGRAEKSIVEYSFNQGFSQPTVIPKMCNAYQYATLLNEIDEYDNRKKRYTDEELQLYKDGTDPWNYPNTDWFAETLKPWSKQSYSNLNMSGGGKKLQYFVSLGYKTQDGFYYNSGTKYNQYDFRSNLDGKVNDYINIDFDISGRMEDRNYPTRSAYEIFNMLMRGKPNMPAYWPNGLPGPDIEYGDNPVVICTKETGYDRLKNYILNSNIKLSIDVPWVKGLNFSATAAFDKGFYFRKRFQTPWYLFTFQGFDENGEPLLEEGKRGVDDPRLSEEMSDDLNILINGLANYNQSFGSHRLNILVGVEKIQGHGDYYSAYRRYFLSTAVDQLFAGGDKEKDNGGSGYENARMNYFGRLNYNYSEKYLVEFLWRYQGSYIFSEENRYGFFPGVSIAYRISREKFWNDYLYFINNFKLRASYGQTANDQIEEWQYLSTYSFGTPVFITSGDAINKTLYESRVPNINVSWEVANQANFGFDMEFFQGKLFLTADYFNYRRSKILWWRNASVPAMTGLTLPRENIGKVQNQGFDFNLGYKDAIKNVRYQISVNGGYNYNKILFWDETPGVPEYQKSTGHPMFTSLYYEAIGVFNDEQDVASRPHWQGARPGDVIFKDVNNDGTIDANDMVRNYYNDIPRFIGGLNMNFDWKGLYANIFIQGAAGVVKYYMTESGDIGNFLEDFYNNRWTKDNPNAQYPRTFNRDDVYWRSQPNTFWLKKTDYLRLKNIEIGYNLSEKWTSKIKVQGIRVYLNGYNLLTYSPDVKDFDPEVGDGSGRSYPLQRVINLGFVLSL
jgi:TonB-linked SusC/RagA family outer membrane protein